MSNYEEVDRMVDELRRLLASGALVEAWNLLDKMSYTILKIMHKRNK